MSPPFSSLHWLVCTGAVRTMVHHTFPYSINKCMGLTSTALHRCPHTCSLGIPTRGRQSGVWCSCRRGKDCSGGGHSGRKTCLTLRKGRQSSFTDRAPPDSLGRPRPGSLRRPCSPPTGRRHATAAAAAASSSPGQPRGSVHGWHGGCSWSRNSFVWRETAPIAWPPWAAPATEAAVPSRPRVRAPVRLPPSSHAAPP